MLTHYYCAFWIPTIFHVKPTLIDRTKKREVKNISDEENIPFWISVSIEERIRDGDPKYDIQIQTLNSREEETSINTLTLIHKESSHNGLLVYQYAVDETIPQLKFVRGKIDNSIYHIIKEFFHKHNSHKPEEDSLLQAFVSSEPFTITDPDNEALIHYLKWYEKKFCNFSRSTSYYFDDTVEAIKTSEKKFKLYTDGLDIISKICEKAIGESLYYKTLLCSKYNSHFHPYLEAHGPSSQFHILKKNEKEDNLRRLAFNTHNAIKNIQLIQFKSSNLYHYYRSLIEESERENTQKILTEITSLQTEVNELVKQNNHLQKEAQDSITESVKLQKKADAIANISLFVGVVALLGTIVSLFI